MQPVVFSLVEALEKKQRTAVASINTDAVEELAQLMDSVEIGMGANFFSSRHTSREPATTLEAHWRGIQVENDGTVRCELCDGNSKFLVTNIHQEDYDAMLRAHCAEVYRPLKKFMTQHLKHVRYVKPSLHRPNRAGDFLDLIAGFTPGVLCGVYVTDITISSSWICFHLAAGAIN